MKYENFNTKNNLIKGLLFLIPILILVLLYIIIPLTNTFIKSFSKDFLTLNNYEFLLEDERTTKSILYTSIIIITSTVMTTCISCLLSFVSRRLDHNLKVILCVMFLLVSVSLIYPFGLTKFFSSHYDGYINGFLMSIGLTPIEFMTSPVYLHSVTILIPILIGLGPLFLLFTLRFVKHSSLKNTLHVAVTLQVVISFLSFYALSVITYYPSYKYTAEVYSSRVHFYYNHLLGLTGISSALLVIMLFFIALLIVLTNGTIHLFYQIKKRHIQLQPNDVLLPIQNRFIMVLIFIGLFYFSLLLLFPFIQAYIDSYKSIEDFFAYPPKLRPSKFTLTNYKEISTLFDQRVSLRTVVYNTLIKINLSTRFLLLILFLTSCGLSLINHPIKKTIRFILTFTFVLSPLLLLKTSLQETNFFNSNIQLIVQSMSFGLSIYLSSMIFETCKRKYRTFTDFMKSIDFDRYLFSILALSLLSSLFTYFDYVNYPTDFKQMSLFQVLRFLPNLTSRYGMNAGLYMITMLYPLFIIMSCVPYVINRISSDH